MSVLPCTCAGIQCAHRLRKRPEAEASSLHTSGGWSGWMVGKLKQTWLRQTHMCGTTRVPCYVCHCTPSRSSFVVVCLCCGQMTQPCLCSLFARRGIQCAHCLRKGPDGEASSLLPSRRKRQRALPRTSRVPTSSSVGHDRVPSYTLPSARYESTFRQVSQPCGLEKRRRSCQPLRDCSLLVGVAVHEVLPD